MDKMPKVFNVNGACRHERHYMVDLSSRLELVRRMVDGGEYFIISKARQYGKTTLLRALAEYLEEKYLVISLDFQNIESDEYLDGSTFVRALAREINRRTQRMAGVADDVRERMHELEGRTDQKVRMAELSACFSEWCERSEKPIVLMIDEIDTAANNQVFLDFLAQLRAAYLDSDKTPAFQSVILAGVYDVRNIRKKFRPEEEHKQNSPWNIAADFDVDMSFSAADIAGMLKAYEADHDTGMDIQEIAGIIHDYTSGYPFLVSRLCKLMDEKLAGSVVCVEGMNAWTKEGVREAVKRLVVEKNTLFESLIGRLKAYPYLKDMIYLLLFQGQVILYNADDTAMDMLLMFGFIKVEDGTVQIANRIFETRLYNYFLTLPEVQNRDIYKLAVLDKNQFIQDGQLNVERILEKFVVHFDDIYGDQDRRFLEEDGRRYFMLYLKPIINGVGNYYVEAQTRNQERTDLIIDYGGTQIIIEMKVWRGNAYHERGEEQLLSYLEHYHLKKGYMLSFNFNKKKEIGVKEFRFGDRILIEAVV